MVNRLTFEDYREGVGKLAKMVEQLELGIIKQALKYDRMRLLEKVKT